MKPRLVLDDGMEAFRMASFGLANPNLRVTLKDQVALLPPRERSLVRRLEVLGRQLADATKPPPPVIKERWTRDYVYSVRNQSGVVDSLWKYETFASERAAVLNFAAESTKDWLVVESQVNPA